MKSFSARLLAVIALLSLTANVLAYFRYTTSRPMVTVGGEAISRKQYQDQLEHRAGQEVLNKMVFTKLVAQAAARANVAPSPKDVDERLAVIQRQAPQLLAPYAGDAAKMAEFREDLSTNMALENVRIKDVALSPADVAAYYARHKGDFALPQQIKTATVVTENSVDAATAEDLLRQHQPYDVIGRQPHLRVVGVNGYNPPLESALASAVKKQISDFVQHAPVGGVKTFRQGASFLTFQVTKSSPAAVPPLSAIRDQVEHAARLALAPTPQQEMARLYQAGPPKFQYDADKYSGYFSAVQNYHVTSDSGKKTARTQ